MASDSKAKAIAALAGKSLEKADPNYVSLKKRSAEEKARSMKRVASVLDEEVASHQGETTAEVANDGGDAGVVVRSFSGKVIDKARLEELKRTRSINEHLVLEAEAEEEERHFDRLARKEAVEEKMLATTEIDTKAVSCAVCKYTATSQSDLCRNQGHRVRWIKGAKKRFFECKNCKRRTECIVDRYPSYPCPNCGGSAWNRTGMIRERKGPVLDSERLLVRGHEQTFVGETVKSSELHVDSIVD